MSKKTTAEWDGKGTIGFVKAKQGSTSDVVVQILDDDAQFVVTKETLKNPQVKMKLQKALSKELVSGTKAVEGKLVLTSPAKQRLALLGLLEGSAEEAVSEEASEDSQVSSESVHTRHGNANEPAFDRVSAQLEEVENANIDDGPFFCKADQLSLLDSFLKTAKEKAAKLDLKPIGSEIHDLPTTVLKSRIESASEILPRVLVKLPDASKVAIEKIELTKRCRVSRILKRLVIHSTMEDIAALTNHPDSDKRDAHKGHQVAEWFAVEVGTRSRCWLPINRIANLDECLPDFFFQEFARLNRKISGLVGSSDFKKELGNVLVLKKGRDHVAKFRVENKSSNPCVNSAKNMEPITLVGVPGVGKTTALRILGRFYYLAGDLLYGHMPSKNLVTHAEEPWTGQGLIGPIVGTTAQKVAFAVQDAEGGIFAVDEAHGLLSVEYGDEAILAWNAEITNKHENVLHAMAGYPEKIIELKEAEPGLASRFTGLEFSLGAFSPQELAQVVINSLKSRGLTVSEESSRALLAFFAPCAEWDSSFGNARAAVKIAEFCEKELLIRAANGIDSLVVTLTDVHAACCRWAEQNRHLIEKAHAVIASNCVVDFQAIERALYLSSPRKLYRARDAINVLRNQLISQNPNGHFTSNKWRWYLYQPTEFVSGSDACCPLEEEDSAKLEAAFQAYDPTCPGHSDSGRRVTVESSVGKFSVDLVKSPFLCWKLNNRGEVNSTELGVLAVRWVSGDANIPQPLYQVVEYAEDDNEESDRAHVQVYRKMQTLNKKALREYLTLLGINPTGSLNLKRARFLKYVSDVTPEDSDEFDEDMESGDLRSDDDAPKEGRASQLEKKVATISKTPNSSAVQTPVKKSRTPVPVTPVVSSSARISRCPSIQKRFPGVDDAMRLTVVKIEGNLCYIAAEVRKFMEQHGIVTGIGKYKNATFEEGVAEALERSELKALKKCIDEESPLKNSRASKLWVVQAEYVNNDLHLEDVDAK